MSSIDEHFNENGDLHAPEIQTTGKRAPRYSVRGKHCQVKSARNSFCKPIDHGYTIGYRTWCGGVPARFKSFLKCVPTKKIDACVCLFRHLGGHC